MIDLDNIGKRIREERKLNKGVSQETMAADLGLHQADISNLECAKKGSGICDLSRLARIADYFGMPLDQLLFGRPGAKEPVRYNGVLEALPEGTPAAAVHLKTLTKLLTQCPEEPLSFRAFRSGYYAVYLVNRPLTLVQPMLSFGLNRLRMYVFFEDRIVATASVTELTVFMLMHQGIAVSLQELIPIRTFDIGEPVRRINPFIALMRFSRTPEEEQEQQNRFFERLEALKPLREEPVLIFESIYVREDSRRLGVARMMLDAARQCYGDVSFWLNMQPADEENMEAPPQTFPTCTPADFGQMNLNAVIAEKLGFHPEDDFWHLKVVTGENEDGTPVISTQRARKIAYRLSPALAEILQDDRDLVELGRARQRIAAEAGDSDGSLPEEDERRENAKMKIIEKENTLDMKLVCPYCGATVLDDDGVHECPHLLFTATRDGMEYIREDVAKATGVGIGDLPVDEDEEVIYTEDWLEELPYEGQCILLTDPPPAMFSVYFAFEEPKAGN